VNRARAGIAGLALSAAALVGIALSEGYTDTAIQPLPGDKWTNGFGSTTNDKNQPLKPGERTDPVKALEKKLRDVQAFEGAVKQCVKVPLHQYEYDAYIDFAYNVGAGAFCKSTMVKKLNVEDFAGACAEFDRWTMYQGRDCRIRENKCYGLAERRARQRAMCEGKP
jgi:lysozyme